MTVKPRSVEGRAVALLFCDIIKEARHSMCLETHSKLPTVAWRARIEEQRRRAKKEAVLWYASRNATRLFDYLGFDHRAVLRADNWPRHARHLLHCPRRYGLSPSERRYLGAGLEALRLP